MEVRVPGHVGSVTKSASRGVQNEIVASAGNLGRVGGKFGRVGETFWTRRRDVLDASAGSLDASAKICGRVGGEFGRVGVTTCTRAEVVSLPMQPNNFEFGRVGVISRMTLRRTL